MEMELKALSRWVRLCKSACWINTVVSLCICILSWIYMPWTASALHVPDEPEVTTFDSHQAWLEWSRATPRKRYINPYPRRRGRIGSQTSDTGDAFEHTTVLQILGAMAGLTVLVMLGCMVKTRTTNSKPKKDSITVNVTTEAPDWIKQIPQLSRKDELGWDRFNKGAGVTITSQKSLYVKGNQEDVTTTEGAIAERGFSDGRHVFAFMWSRDQRHVPNAHLAVGIGYPFDMNGEYYGPLVGGNDKSYGFNLTDNGLYFCGSRVAVFPPKKDQSFCLPTLFFMYVDLIESKLGFGGENEFWGVAFDFSEKRPMKEVPLYPMVAFANVTGKFMMFYKGQVPPGETTSPISDNVKDNMCLKPDTLPAKPSTTQATTQLPPQHALSRAVNVVNIHNVIYSGALSVSNSPVGAHRPSGPSSPLGRCNKAFVSDSASSSPQQTEEYNLNTFSSSEETIATEIEDVDIRL